MGLQEIYTKEQNYTTEWIIQETTEIIRTSKYSLIYGKLIF